MATPAVKIGDVWDALDKVSQHPASWACGTAYLGELALPTRGFADARIASPTILNGAVALGAHPVASGNYG